MKDFKKDDETKEKIITAFIQLLDKALPGARWIQGPLLRGQEELVESVIINVSTDRGILSTKITLCEVPEHDHLSDGAQAEIFRELAQPFVAAMAINYAASPVPVGGMSRARCDMCDSLDALIPLRKPYSLAVRHICALCVEQLERMVPNARG